MDLLLQIWAGGFYLLNKLFLSIANRYQPATKRVLRLAGWITYLFGAPAWCAVLLMKSNWIAAAVQLGTMPAMMLGLYITYTNTTVPHRAADLVTRIVTYGVLAVGIGYSVYDYGGITTVTQCLELVVMIGFLIGTYLLAKNNPRGWFCFMCMHISMAILMFMQEKPLLAAQQVLSFLFAVYGVYSARQQYL